MVNRRGRRPSSMALIAKIERLFPTPLIRGGLLLKGSVGDIALAGSGRRYRRVLFTGPPRRTNSRDPGGTIFQRHRPLTTLREGGLPLVSGGFWETIKVLGGRDAPFKGLFYGYPSPKSGEKAPNMPSIRLCVTIQRPNTRSETPNSRGNIKIGV